MTQEEFEKQEAEKELKWKAFQNRWEIYIQTFEQAGFTREQAEKLVYEFSELKDI